MRDERRKNRRKLIERGNDRYINVVDREDEEKKTLL